MAAVAGEMEYSKYGHSRVHLAVLCRNYHDLEAILAGLQPVADPSAIRTEDDANADTDVADARSTVVDFRDARTGRETPLHLAVRLADPVSVLLLMEAGADWTHQNDRGWTALDEALLAGHREAARTILRHAKRIQSHAWRRARPLVARGLSAAKDFYAEISLGFDSAVLPFLSRIAPSETVRIRKRGADVRVDTTLDGFEIFKTRRADRSFLFLGESCGSLCVVSHKSKTVRFFDGQGSPPSEEEIEREVADMMGKRVTRTGIDVTEARLEPTGATETVGGKWVAREYRVRNGYLSYKSHRAASSTDCNPYVEDAKQVLDEEEVKELSAALSGEWDAESSGSSADTANAKRSKKKSVGSVFKKIAPPLRNITNFGENYVKQKFGKKSTKSSAEENNHRDEDDKEMKMDLKSDIWLSNDFPLEIKELVPVLDVLGRKCKIIKRLKEVLTAKLPDGTFPVKVTFPIAFMGIRVSLSFVRFEELNNGSEFFTPPSTPPSSPTTSVHVSDTGDDAQDYFRIPPDFTRI